MTQPGAGGPRPCEGKVNFQVPLLSWEEPASSSASAGYGLPAQAPAPAPTGRSLSLGAGPRQVTQSRPCPGTGCCAGEGREPFARGRRPAWDRSQPHPSDLPVRERGRKQLGRRERLAAL